MKGHIMAQKIAVPKGAKHGSVVTRGGKKYKVISYRRNGKAIRYLTPLAAMQRALAKARRANKSGAKTTARKKTATKKRSATTAGKVSIPKGKRVGQCFKRGSKCYTIATVPTAKGGKRRYARLISAATYAAKTGKKPATKRKSTAKKATRRRNPGRSNPGQIYLAGIGYI